MASTVQFDLGGGSTLSLTSTGPSTAQMVEAGVVYELENITYAPGHLSCDVAGPFNLAEAHIDVTLTPRPGGEEETLLLQVTKAWLPSEDRTTDYVVPATSAAELEAFGSPYEVPHEAGKNK